MPARNVHHDAVVHALIADGWTITHDPLTLPFGGKDLYVDLGAERATIAAEKNSHKIAVEIQSFLSASPVRDLEEQDLPTESAAPIRDRGCPARDTGTAKGIPCAAANLSVLLVRRFG